MSARTSAAAGYGYDSSTCAGRKRSVRSACSAQPILPPLYTRTRMQRRRPPTGPGAARTTAFQVYSRPSMCSLRSLDLIAL
jgi:hypothetical protein